ncbi:hypothetical protein D3C83_143020 [compost metagenome]
MAVAGRAVGEQLVKAGCQVRSLLVQAGQFREAAVDMGASHVLAPGLQAHLADPERQDRQPVDHRAGRLAMESGIRTGPDGG